MINRYKYVGSMQIHEHYYMHKYNEFYNLKTVNKWKRDREIICINIHFKNYNKEYLNNSMKPHSINLRISFKK
jgi:hypothetical protein